MRHKLVIVGADIKYYLQIIIIVSVQIKATAEHVLLQHITSHFKP